MCIILIVLGNCHYFVSNGKCIWFLILSVMYKRSCVMSNSKYVKHIHILLSVNVIVLCQTISLLGTVALMTKITNSFLSDESMHTNTIYIRKTKISGDRTHPDRLLSPHWSSFGTILL